jgi:hypothetical protein
MKLGIIQSRGLGDIIIALPIARYYLDELGYEQVLWPVCEEFYSHVKEAAPWVKWIPVPTDTRGDFFYTEPEKRLKNFKVDEILCLYQALNVRPELSQQPYFQLQHFDEFKYTKAGVPFLKKWTLKDCITRDPRREAQLIQKLGLDVSRPYVVYHTQGSSYRCEADLSAIPEDWQRIEITEITDSIFDWVSILEQATALILIDSVFSNLVDQLLIDVDKYWIPRSHIHLTPVLGTQWTILEAPSDSLAAKQIFSPG